MRPSNKGRQQNRQHQRDQKQRLNHQQQGQEIKALSSEDEQEATTEKILLEPWVKNTEGLNQEQTIEGMKQEIRSMKAQQVYTEVSFSNLTKAQQSKVIKSRWVLRQKGNSVRARIVAKGYAEEVNDNDDIYASTPIFCVLRLLLTMALTFNLFMFPPTEFYNPEDNIVWKLNKAIYGLRSSPKAWQNHLAETLQQLGMQRLASEPNVFKTATGNAATPSSSCMWMTSYSWESQQLSTSFLQTYSNNCYCDQQVTLQ